MKSAKSAPSDSARSDSAPSAAAEAVPLRRRGSPWVPRLLVAVAVGYFGLIVLFPLAGLVQAVFTAEWPTQTPLFDPPLVEPTPNAVSAEESRSVAVLRELTRAETLTAFGLTLLAAAAAVVVNTVFGTLTAWVLVRKRFPGRGVLNGLIDLPFAVSPVVAGYMILLLYGRGGWLTGLTDALGFKVAFALPAVVLATVFVSLPFVVRELIPVLEELGTEQEQAAATLGAGPWQTFWRVSLPGMKWGLIYGAMLTVARAFGEYGAVAVAGGAVAGRTETATLFIDRMLLERQQPTALVACLLLVLMSVAVVAGLELLGRQRPAC